MAIQVNAMAPQTRTLSLRISKGQYEQLEDFVDRGDYTSKSEFIRELLRNYFDDYSQHLLFKATKERNRHISLDEYIKSRGLE